MANANRKRESKRKIAKAKKKTQMQKRKQHVNQEGSNKYSPESESLTVPLLPLLQLHTPQSSHWKPTDVSKQKQRKKNINLHFCDTYAEKLF